MNVYTRIHLCSKTVNEFLLRGTYVGILGYVLGRLVLTRFIHLWHHSCVLAGV